MPFRALAAGLMVLASLSGCGAADTYVPSSPSIGAPAVQAQPTPAATDRPATQSQAAATEIPMTQEGSDSSLQPAPTPPPRPTLEAAPLWLPESAAPTPPNSAVVATPLGPGLAAMVDVARADLARRQSVAIEAVELVEVRSVVWPDRGLGCPRPGMVYPQVQVDGLLIRLRVGDRTFDYHGDGVRPPFLCEKRTDGRATPPPGADVEK
jgi:hypothetical protein